MVFQTGSFFITFLNITLVSVTRVPLSFFIFIPRKFSTNGLFTVFKSLGHLPTHKPVYQEKNQEKYDTMNENRGHQGTFWGKSNKISWDEYKK